MNTLTKNNLFRIVLLIVFCMLGNTFVSAQEVVELKLPKSEKIIVKLMFRNGSICDPVGKEGLTSLTANLITDGGTKDKTSTELKDFI